MPEHKLNQIIISDKLLSSKDGIPVITIGIEIDNDMNWYPLSLSTAFSIALQLLKCIDTATTEPEEE